MLELPPCECGLEMEDGGPPADELGKAVNHLRETCRVNAIRISGVPIPTIIYDWGVRAPLILLTGNCGQSSVLAVKPIYHQS